MAVNAIGGTGIGAAPNRPNGPAAQLAEARAMLRAAAPADSWEAVNAEVQRLQNDRGIPALAALHAVYGRLAAGWTPSAGSSGL
jgi:hypothetical protein